MSDSRPYINPASQAEKREILESSLLGRAQADSDLGSGRFKKETTTRVTGVPTYPSLPASSPWASPDPTGEEAPLGYSVDAMDHGKCD